MVTKNRLKGFTLIELMIAVVILAILGIIAMQTFLSQARAGKRADGINTVLAVALAEERYRTNNTSYGTLAQVYGGVTTSPQGFYTVAVSSVTATGYTITATGVGGQVNDKSGGTACSPLVYTMSSGTISTTPAVCWPS